MNLDLIWSRVIGLERSAKGFTEVEGFEVREATATSGLGRSSRHKEQQRRRLIFPLNSPPSLGGFICQAGPYGTWLGSSWDSLQMEICPVTASNLLLVLPSRSLSRGKPSHFSKHVLSIRLLGTKTVASKQQSVSRHLNTTCPCKMCSAAMPGRPGKHPGPPTPLTNCPLSFLL